MQAHTFCSYCGAKFTTEAKPRTCAACNNTTWFNPTPVVVMLVPIGRTASGLLTVRRAIEPKKGLLALPSGYIDEGESWQQAAIRELKEETGVEQSIKSVRLFRVVSAFSYNTLLIFCRMATVEVLPSFTPNEEVSELVTIHEPVELAFSTHTNVVRQVWGYP